MKEIKRPNFQRCICNKQFEILTILMFIATMLHGCTPPAVPWTGSQVNVPRLNVGTITEEVDQENYDWENQNYREREEFPEFPDEQNYSFWKDESTWGNLFRDPKAQFIGDLVLINNISQLIPNTVSETLLDIEIHAIQTNILEISAEVTNVLPNGVLALYAEKIDYIEGDSIRYVTTIRGYARKTDIDENNLLNAQRMTRAEINTSKAYKLSDIDDIRRRELRIILDEINANKNQPESIFDNTN